MIHKPSSTYRLQLTPDFRFEHCTGLVDYLSKLGISDIYLSPIFASRKGSQHGYDVVNMNEINEELGGREGFETLVHAASERGMNIILDVVPNHRAFDGDNEILMNVLENGPYSPYYNFFDVFWEHPYENIRGRILAPFLGDFYARVLERGELRLQFSEAGFRVKYWDSAFPIRPGSWNTILRCKLGELVTNLGARHPDVVKLQGVIHFVENLKVEREKNPDFDHGAFIKKLLWNLYTESDSVRDYIDRVVEEINGNPESPDSYNTLDEILNLQNYRLSYWKVGTEELNYRRFFSINDLISLRIEDADVFAHTHKLLFELIQSGKVKGIRLDHIDGLFDPTQYLERLRANCPDLYIVSEKILEPEEKLPEYWPIQGTTGYEFMDAAAGLLTDATHEHQFEELYRVFIGEKSDYEKLVFENKRNIIGKHMAGDIDNLALQLKEITNRNRHGNDLTMYSVRRALVEILTFFPIYRTYVSGDYFSDEDRKVIEGVIARCRKEIPRLANELDLIGAQLLQVGDAEEEDEEDEKWRMFLMRLQQYTGPLMAKGVEDSVFYIYNRLISRNEVGSSPVVFGYTVEEFHRYNSNRAQSWPLAMNGTSTHDTKRGEDTRLRIAVLSEGPTEWANKLREWNTANLQHKTFIDGEEAPTANEEYAIYQTMIGACPVSGLEHEEFRQRIKDWAIKAAREAKVNTSWLNPIEAYEEALLKFIDAIFDKDSSKEFLDSFLPYRDRIAYYGALNSLAQCVLKGTSPGIPDFYQGTEYWDLSLVDPDNRRPVDFEARRNALNEFHGVASSGLATIAEKLAANPMDPRIKLFVVSQVLQTRAKLPDVFSDGEYLPVSVEGPHSRQLVAYQRSLNGKSILVVVPRFFSSLTNNVSTSLIPATTFDSDRLSIGANLAGNWRSAFTGRVVKNYAEMPVSDLLRDFPVGLWMAV